MEALPERGAFFIVVVCLRLALNLRSLKGRKTEQDRETKRY